MRFHLFLTALLGLGFAVPAAYAAGEGPAAATQSPGPADAPAPAPRDLGFSPHEPLYFSVGLRRSVDAKFQFSFKFRPVGPSDDRIAGRNPVENIYMSFTQTSLWDIGKTSAPFRDSSYKPAMFWFLKRAGGLLGADFGYAAGVEHESNGKDGASSRSINVAFLRPTLTWRSGEWEWCVSPRAIAYIEKEDNPDIVDYRGYGEVNAWIGLKNSWRVAAMGRHGLHRDGRGSLQVDVSYPLARISRVFRSERVHGYLHFQYFTGWGESILEYRVRTPSQVRLGFMTLR